MESFNTFVGQSVRHFIITGSLLPSSKRLAKRMVKNVNSKVILELGPGTGVFTKEILKILPKHGLLISVESNGVFVDHIKKQIKDERLKLHRGNALLLKKFLKENGVNKVDCIISGLPIGNFKREDKQKILKEIAESLSDDGVFIQFEYFLAGIRSVKEFFPDITISYEFFNIPPAFVMRCKKIKK